jgi:hypothetical protein
MTRFTRIVFWASLIATGLCLVGALFGLGFAGFVFVTGPTAALVVIRTAWQCAPYRHEAESLLTCVRRRTAELGVEAAYPRLVHQLGHRPFAAAAEDPHQRYAALVTTVNCSQGRASDPLGRCQPARLDCDAQHVVVVWCDHRVQPGAPVYCPLHHRFGPAELAHVHTLLPGLSGEAAIPTVHLAT